MPTGWTTDGPGTWSVGSGDYSTSTGAGQGTYNALINHSSTGNVTKLITPEIDLSSVSSAELSFMHVQRSWAGDIDQLRVYYRTSSSGSWTELVAYTAAFASWTTESEIILPNLSSTYQLAFEHTDNYGYGVGLDDIKIVRGATCVPPTLNPAEYITEEGASLSWTENGTATQWWLQYSTDANFTTYNQRERNGIPMLAIADLLSGTKYYARVKADCDGGDLGGDESNWSNVISFTTQCATMSTYPYSENFDSYATDIAISTSAPSTYPNHELPNCWSFLNLSETTSTYPQAFLSSNSTYAVSGNCLFFKSSSTTPLYAILPEFAEAISGLQLTLTYRNEGATTANGTLYVGYMTDPTDASTFTSVYTCAQTTTKTTINPVYFTNAPAGSRMALQYQGGSSNNYYLGVDDVIVEEVPSCLLPTNLTHGTPDAHSVELNWTAGGTETSWEVCLEGNEDNPTMVSDNPTYTFTGLAGETTYTAKVRAYCSAADQSEWVSTSFTTAIACPAPTGLTADLTPGNGTIATLSWTETASATEWVLEYSTASDFTGASSVNVTGTPTKDLTNLTAEATYYARVKAACGGEDGESSWSATCTFIPTNAYTLTVNDGTNTNGYVPVYGTWVDDITKSQFIIPAESLTDMAYGTITSMTFYSNKASVNWGNAQFDVYMVETSETTLSELADYGTMLKVMNAGSLGISGNQMVVEFDTPFEYTNGNLMIGFLQTNSGTWSSCDWYGITAEGASMGGYSTTISQQNFLPKTTFAYVHGAVPTCLAPTDLTVTNVMPTTATLNWSGEAESYNVQYRVAASDVIIFEEGFENGLSNWTIYTESESPNTEGWVVYNGSNIAGAGNHSGSYVASAWSWASEAYNANNWLITPQVDLQGTLTFWETTAGNWPDSYEVLLSTTGNNISDFTITLREMQQATGGWSQVNIDLSSYSGQGYIAIHHVSYDANYLFIDDFGIYNTIEAGEWTNATSATNTIDITGLTPEKEYEWQVQADCGDEDGVSSWSAIATFTTPSACAAPTGLAYELDVNVAELSWTGFTETYNVQYREVDPDAPVTIILNVPTDIWGDDTGYQLVLDADHNTYGNTIPTSGNFTAGSFADFEYTVPENAECNASTTTIVVEGSATITIPAGVYDYVFLNPDPSSGTYYIAASQDGFFPSRGDDFEFVSGQTYEFTLSLNGSNDAITANISDNGNAWTLVEDVYGHYHTIFGLESETTYEAQVQGVDCSDDNNTDWSESVFFTTEAFTVFYKEIAGYGDQSNAGGYYLIASPIGYVYPNRVGQMTENAFDLYRFNQEASNEWEAYNTHGFQLEPGKGYLYANSEDVTLAFYGNPFEEMLPIGLTYVSDNDWAGWNLVGNPYAETAYIEGIDGEAVSFYTMNPEGSRLIPVSSFTSIEPMEGVFVYAQSEGEGLNFVLADPVKGSLVSLDLSDNNGLVDRAMINFDACRPLPKFQLNDNSTKLYITLDNEDYAAVRSEEVGEMPVSFKAEENGIYTLSISAENVEFGYLHLIDNLTGDDVDLLQTPSYSFTARTTDNVNRFKLVYATGILSVSENFAFFSNGSFVINNEGDATLQVIDLNGRVISSETINGCANVNVSGAAGVYLIRLVNGENVRVQKVVVK